MQLPVENQRTNRLIVFLPGYLAGNRELAYKVFWMAHRGQSDVYYLTLVIHEDTMLSTNLRITTS